MMTTKRGSVLRQVWVGVGLALLNASSPSIIFAFGKSDVGTSGVPFLKIGPGARPTSMGDAFTAVADDVHSLYYNPAGLSQLRHPELTAMHMQWFQDVSYEFAAFAYPTKNAGTWGFAVTNLHTDHIQRRTEDTDTSNGEFGSSDAAYWIGYGHQLTSRLSLGANAKFIRSTLDNQAGNAYAVDGGLLYNTGWKSLKFGASIKNLGSKIKYVDDSDPLPMEFRLGAAFQPIAEKLILSSDLILPRDHQAGLALGGEYRHPLWSGSMFAARGGYRTDSDVKDGLSGVSAGAGLEMGRFAFDFGWVPFGILGNTYRYALHIKFGPDATDDTRLRQDARLALPTSNY